LQGASGAAWAKCLGYKKVYILDDRQLYGKGIADVFDKRAKELGLEVVGHDGVESVNIDFRALLTKVKASGADLVYFGGLVDSGGPQIIQQMDALGFFKAGVIMMSDMPCTPKLSPGASRAPQQLPQTFASLVLINCLLRWVKILHNYKAMAKDPIGWSLYSYNAVLVILDSIKRAAPKLDAAKTVDERRAAILEAMRVTKDLPGVSGPITFDENGDPTPCHVRLSSWMASTSTAKHQRRYGVQEERTKMS
jgi:branched-chain amino acid transport system substrate-binding protein